MKTKHKEGQTAEESQNKQFCHNNMTTGTKVSKSTCI